MSKNKQKLELTWIGKSNPEYDIANIEPRILEEDPKLSNCKNDPNTENMIIHGDNLLALRALLPEYAGEVKCIYIDPPYNTRSAFDHYDDSVEHSTWLSLMKPRLELLKSFLKHEDGVIFISIDDNEMPYLRVLADEVFGRKNNVCTLIWQKVYSPKNQSKRISIDHEYILVYARNESKLDFNLLERTEEMNKRYKNPDNDPRGPWKPGDLISNEERTNGHYIITGPHGDQFDAPLGKHWAFNEKKMMAMIKDNRVVFGKNGKSIPAFKQFLSEVQQGRKATTILLHGEVGHNDEAKKEVIKINPNDVFTTPKPERLIKRVFELSTKKGDLILDSFLGSGTAAAVAHKMGRKYIGIEMGDHAYTHCKARLDKVISGTDGLKLSETLEWEGGGAYKFYELAPSFIVNDEFGNPVIDDFYNDTKLIKAMCKLMNFTYKPSETEYWKHGVGQGKNYLYVTTQFLTTGMVQQIMAHLDEGESLVICPKKFEPGADKVDDRIMIKKIPQSVLKSCHFGKKEYLLPIKKSALEEIDLDDDNNE